VLRKILKRVDNLEITFLAKNFRRVNPFVFFKEKKTFRTLFRARSIAHFGNASTFNKLAFNNPLKRKFKISGLNEYTPAPPARTFNGGNTKVADSASPNFLEKILTVDRFNSNINFK
jgi:hypothetical protein